MYNLCRSQVSGLLLCLFLVLAGGCHEDNPERPDVQPGPGLYLPQDSPANCLQNLIHAYTACDSVQYAKLFAREFPFVFVPHVSNPVDPFPQSWGLRDERQAAANMFRNSLVDRIDLSWTQGDTVNSSYDFPDTWKVLASQVDLRVHTRQADGSPHEFYVRNGLQLFYFKKYPMETASNGRPLWRIWQWEDWPQGEETQAGPEGGREQADWGTIKVHFR